MPRARALEAVRQARADVYRKLVLEAAERLFAEHGFEATRIQEIAEAAGLSVGTLYGIVPGKKELHRQIQELRGVEILEHVRTVVDLDSRSSPVQLLLQGIRAYVDYLVLHPDYLRMQLHDGVAWATGPARSTTEQYEAWAAGQRLATEIFTRAVEQGLVVHEDPVLLARTMIAMQQVHLARWVEQGMQQPAADLIDGIVRQFRRSFLRDPGST